MGDCDNVSLEDSNSLTLDDNLFCEDFVVLDEVFVHENSSPHKLSDNSLYTIMETNVAKTYGEVDKNAISSITLIKQKLIKRMKHAKSVSKKYTAKRMRYLRSGKMSSARTNLKNCGLLKSSKHRAKVKKKRSHSESTTESPLIKEKYFQSDVLNMSLPKYNWFEEKLASSAATASSTTCSTEVTSSSQTIPVAPSSKSTDVTEITIVADKFGDDDNYLCEDDDVEEVEEGFILGESFPEACHSNNIPSKVQEEPVSSANEPPSSTTVEELSPLSSGCEIENFGLLQKVKQLFSRPQLRKTLDRLVIDGIQPPKSSSSLANPTNPTNTANTLSNSISKALAATNSDNNSAGFFLVEDPLDDKLSAKYEKSLPLKKRRLDFKNDDRADIRKRSPPLASRNKETPVLAVQPTIVRTNLNEKALLDTIDSQIKCEKGVYQPSVVMLDSPLVERKEPTTGLKPRSSPKTGLVTKVDQTVATPPKRKYTKRQYKNQINQRQLPTMVPFSSSISSKVPVSTATIDLTKDDNWSVSPLHNVANSHKGFPANNQQRHYYNQLHGSKMPNQMLDIVHQSSVYNNGAPQPSSRYTTYQPPLRNMSKVSPPAIPYSQLGPSSYPRYSQTPNEVFRPVAKAPTVDINHTPMVQQQRVESHRIQHSDYPGMAWPIHHKKYQLHHQEQPVYHKQSMVNPPAVRSQMMPPIQQMYSSPPQQHTYNDMSPRQYTRPASAKLSASPTGMPSLVPFPNAPFPTQQPPSADVTAAAINYLQQQVGYSPQMQEDSFNQYSNLSAFVKSQLQKPW